MPREALIKKLDSQLSSGNCDISKVTIQYLTETEKLLFRQLRRKEITEKDYNFQTTEIKCIKNTIEDLQSKVKNLQDELNKMKNENNYLCSEMDQLSRNLSLIQLNENNGELIKKNIHDKRNALKKIREIIDAYKK
ncbi:19433_t:CDS:1 [Dentiscutata erythropus]|uniref:19433_t:CDS:1 n=1 Tax=Dentiscutata erythropus TaxID=1348616 RepID=A0A9N9EMF4_9GLOM|nr:19433_t:CDS:1 [Dentiscutata erythropus]